MTHSEIEKLLKGILDKDLPGIFHYEETPSEEEFQKIYDFYSETLKNFSDYGIDPALIYFNNKRNRNAFACKRKNHYIISFNSGTIIYLVKFFQENNFQTKRQDLENQLDTKVNTLMYQLCLHYTLYHEMAHLIQDSKFLGTGLNELHYSNEKFDNLKHLLELDADQFSALCTGSHLINYLDRLNLSSSKMIDHVLSIAISSIMVYVLSFNPDEKLYFDKYHHPHASIRLSLITQTVIDYTYQDRLGRDSTRQERKNIIVNAGNIVQNGTKSNLVLNYIQTLVENYPKIKEYIEGYTLINNEETNLATDKWNEMAQ